MKYQESYNGIVIKQLSSNMWSLEGVKPKFKWSWYFNKEELIALRKEDVDLDEKIRILKDGIDRYKTMPL